MAPIIVIDPGHARGSDKKGCNGFSEQRHNLLMAKTMQPKFEAYGFKVILTRTNETDDPSLSERGRMAKGADSFLSVHTNGSTSNGALGLGRGRGVTVFNSVDLPGDAKWAQKLSDKIARGLVIPSRGDATKASAKYFSRPDPSEKEDYLTVIDSAQDAGCKHVFLSESGFHDNPQDCAAMRTPAGIEKIAQAHLEVFAELLGMYPVPTTPPVVQPKPPVINTNGFIYTVVKGDSPSKIAKKFGVDVDLLMALNKIADPRKLGIGNDLVIPGRKVTDYRVKPGDTLGEIGKAFGVRWQDIMEFNGIAAPKYLRANTTILIPLD
jgi:LysM repeat protein